MKNYLKLRKHTLKNMYKFLQSLTDKPLFDKRLVFPDELMHGTFEITCVKCQGVIRGTEMPSSRGRDKIANTPPPGLTT